MMLESAELIADYLARNRAFEECILDDVQWRHFGSVIELTFDYIWSSEGAVRPEYARRDPRVLTFHNVQEFHLWNGMTEHMSLHPEELNWGFSEVSSVRLVDDADVLGKYRHLPVPLHHVCCEWEGQRRVDIVFSTMEVQ